MIIPNNSETRDDCSFLFWVVIILVSLGIIARLTLYAIYGPDSGMVEFIQETLAVSFSGLDTMDQRQEMYKRLSKMYKTSLQQSDQQQRTPNNNDDISYNYANTNYPCESFYDAVCGVFDSTGQSNLKEDTENPIHVDQGGGLFKEASNFSQRLLQSLVKENNLYKKCMNINMYQEYTWNKIQIPHLDLIQTSNLFTSNNKTRIGLVLLAKLISNGLDTPLDVSVEKLIHESVFGVSFSFNMLPILDITFNSIIMSTDSNDRTLGERPSSLVPFYDQVLLENPNITKGIMDDDDDDKEDILEMIKTWTNINTSLDKYPYTRELLENLFNTTQILPHWYAPQFKNLEDVVRELVVLIGNEPLVYWDYFNRLSFYYTMEEFSYRNKTTTARNMITIYNRTTWITVKKAASVGWIKKLLFDGYKEKKIRLSSGKHVDITHRYTIKKWLSNYKRNVEINLHYKPEKGHLAMTIQRYGVDTKTREEACHSFVSKMDRLKLNIQMSYINNLHFENQEEGEVRTSAVANLVGRILDSVKDLINEAHFVASNVKYKLIQKMDQISIRIKGLSSDIIKLQAFKNSTNDDDDADLAKVIYRFLSLQYRVNIAKMESGSYLEYRTNSSFHLWEDVNVPYEIVNAWYDPLENVITIPIGITLLPLFQNSPDLDDSSLGVIIGHECGHGLDNNGRFFDHYGNYMFNNTPDVKNDDGIWEGQDFQFINSSMTCLANDYGHPCNNKDYGQHTLNEDIADQIGILSGLKYVQKRHAEIYDKNYGNISHSMVGMLKDYFVRYVRLWCGRIPVEKQCDLVKRDPHALAKHRVNKALKQIKEFRDVFQCKETTNMYKRDNDTCLIYNYK